MNGCAPGLALIERFKATRKWATQLTTIDVLMTTVANATDEPRIL